MNSYLDQAAFAMRREEGSQSSFLLLPSMRWVDRHLNWWGRLPVPMGEGSLGAGGGAYPGFAPRPLVVLALLGVGAGVLFSLMLQAEAARTARYRRWLNP